MPKQQLAAVVPLVSSEEGFSKKDLLAALNALKKGDFSVRLPENLKGVDGQIAETFNSIAVLNQTVTAEFERISRAVGKEGRINERVTLNNQGGSRLDWVRSINALIGDLVWPTSEMARVIGAVAHGDLSQSITLKIDRRPLKGEFLRTAKIVNTMVDQLGSFASEVTRVAREVGTEGKLGGQAVVKGVSGTWKDLTDNVNLMANNLTSQVRNIAQVTTAVAKGDLSKKITVAVKGEILELKNTINTMVDQLSSFASEVTRVAREVGTEGNLGGQAVVKGVSGTWKDLTENVNFMASNLTNQVRNIAKVTTAVATGDLSKKITVAVKGEILELKDTINTMVDQLSSFASEVTRVAREVGTEGRLGGQADVKGVSGTWKDLTENVNFMANNLTGQVRGIAKVVTAVANGDLSKKITVDVKGEILELKDTINTLVEQLSSFASEVTRVAREVGTEGKLGGQADVKGVSGTWKDLTENVNFMANNLTGQVRGIAKVVTAVANGNLKQKLAVEAMGEIAALADTINGMIETLATFAEQVTTVAREVGVEGQLGGQASVPGAAGTWKDLTDNVNQLAANLTTQVRAIAEVATAVTKGDLTRSIAVQARGEVAALKDNINEMIRNLRDTTEKTTEQDWLKTNLAKFTRMLQGQRDLMTVGKLILSELAPVVNAQHGAFYMMDTISEDEPKLKLLASYAYKGRKDLAQEFKLGEGIVGECALEKQRILLTNVPNDYIQISSGLGEAKPLSIVVLPALFEGQVKAVLELASFDRFISTHHVFLEQLTESIGIVLNTIEANMRTEELLKQSQSLAHELQSQQGELKRTNEELEHKAHLLVKQKAEVEGKNREVEQARQALEEKATQLALTSKYKSEFLANMSHELRTPLNSLLILAQQLSANPEGNLTPKQREFSRTIYSSGSDLLALINDILDLSKIESGTVVLDIDRVQFRNLHDYVERNFRHVAEAKNLGYSVALAMDLPPTIVTDVKRLQQVLKNLLSNAFKFTEKGKVELQIGVAARGWSPDNEVLNHAETVIAFSVRDTGIGIQEDKQRLIFEAFQQADGTTSRKYGGTGLGLSISREIARLLGGEIKLTSQPGEGSTFTLYLPQQHRTAASAAPLPADAEAARAHPLMTPAVAPATVSIVEEIGGVDAVVKDDRETLKDEDPSVLVIEDDVEFAQRLTDRSRAAGFKVLVASRSDMAADLVHHYNPKAILLDINLADIDAWKFLDRLKNNLQTRHIPVTLISLEEERERGRRQGGLQCLTKPVSDEELDRALGNVRACIERPLKTLLVVEDNDVQRMSIEQLIGSDDLEIRSVGTAREALQELRTRRIDCLVLDLGLPDMTGLELLEEIKKEPRHHDVPIIVYTGRALTREEESRIQKLSQTLIIKDVRSPERLFDKTALYLHRVHAKLPEDKRQLLERIHQTDLALAGKKVLVVDDDMRNIFAVTSLLERHDMTIVAAENGKDAIEALHRSPDIDIVLMDIMMPEMDGYETTQAIRKNKKFKALPIIALTAKAMKGDRQKCIEAGASDFIAKPVDTEQLLSFLRVWLYR
ncbi:MAG TPA: response regulator [bacterium]|nr:response regulator [bacterium]